VRSLSSAAQMAMSDCALPRATPCSPDDQYVLGPDSSTDDSVPHGRVLKFHHTNSRIYPGFERKWWLYVPPGYDGTTPLALMVFQDGERYLHRDGFWRAPVVLNNLLARSEIPELAAAFINSGVAYPKAPDGSPLQEVSNRSVEYDTLSAAYASFLLEEILPQIQEHVRLAEDPDYWGIGGHSSGGICAFTVAWSRPDKFRRVLANNGSFVDIRGGNVYPELVRRSERKPIRVFQQGGANDVVPYYSHLSWPQANHALAAALVAKGYEHKFAFGEGTHDPYHAGAIFPDAMRWLWSDSPRSPYRSPADHFITNKV
jgi:enterochelin esterase-like enzyme